MNQQRHRRHAVQVLEQIHAQAQHRVHANSRSSRSRQRDLNCARDGGSVGRIGAAIRQQHVRSASRRRVHAILRADRRARAQHHRTRNLAARLRQCLNILQHLRRRARYQRARARPGQVRACGKRRHARAAARHRQGAGGGFRHVQRGHVKRDVAGSVKAHAASRRAARDREQTRRRQFGCGGGITDCDLAGCRHAALGVYGERRHRVGVAVAARSHAGAAQRQAHRQVGGTVECSRTRCVAGRCNGARRGQLLRGACGQRGGRARQARNRHRAGLQVGGVQVLLRVAQCVETRGR
ncbi:hypothetical protein LMG3441_06210 [Achromobacter kerstersii]|uniref:Uncharacterized protein n=1 Tax=Achromobacter kerstersii TaxID=1353890 RepID=A0A6S7C9W7_9BURK|nr:hypothetical protein LMG3441_06210 [Achromobacter kerstersii]